MKVVVVGRGSVGSRHARILSGMGCDVSVVTSRPVSDLRCFSDIASACSQSQPEYVVIATPTSCHISAVEELARLEFRGKVLVEKPLFAAPQTFTKNDFASFKIAYNLRFHPALLELRNELKGETIISASVYAGQFLPEWRPGTDYRQSYSARQAEGGGVLRDLSHELDYMMLLLGPWQAVAALGGHRSRLEIDSDDVFALLLRMERCPVTTLEMNYLDKTARRRIVINTEAHTYEADLIRNTLRVDRNEEKVFSVDRDLTYTAQHQAMFDGKNDVLCDWSEGMRVLELIHAAETAAAGQRWVAR